MNDIPKDQNSQKQLERLAAQRELYSSAKKIYATQLIFTIVIPVTLAIISLIRSDIAVWAAIFGVLIFVVDVSIFEPSIKSRKVKAAKIQELFDCEVLRLPKSPLKVVDDITVEEVLLYYKAHIKIASNEDKIKNWYDTQVGKLPLTIARILCQRTNCWWDSKLRERYSAFLKYSTMLVFGGIIILGIITDLTLIQVTLIASGLIPYFQTSIKQCNENIETANRLNELIKFADHIWDDALSGKHGSEYLKDNSRRLQDEIFEHRSKSPLILDCFYKLFRDESEQLMNRSTEILIAEAESKLHI